MGLMMRSLLVGAALAASLTATAQASTVSTFFGAGTQWAVAHDAPHLGTYADAMQRIGFGTARQDLFWDLVEPDAPSGATHHYLWGYAPGEVQTGSPDWLVATLAARGLTWAPVIDTVPPWAQPSGNPYRPPSSSHYADLTAFMRAAAARYGDPSSAFWTDWQAAHPGLPARPVTQYEVWNEENAAGPFIAPSTYWQVYDAVASGVKAAQPGAQVQIGGLFYQPAGNQPSAMSYLSSLFAAAPPGWSPDAVGMHPYASGLTGIVGHFREFQAALQTAAAAHQPQLASLPILVNELGFPAEPADVWQPSHLNAGIQPDGARAAEISLLADAWWHSDCNVQSFLPFGITAPEGGGGYAENWQELVRRNTGADTPMSLALAQSVLRATGAGAGAPEIHMCGSAGDGPALALDDLAVSKGAACSGGTTWTARVAYRGNPVPDATVRWAVGSAGGDAGTNSAGTTSFCAPGGVVTAFGFVGSPFYHVPIWARSGLWSGGTPLPVTTAIDKVAAGKVATHKPATKGDAAGVAGAGARSAGGRLRVLKGGATLDRRNRIVFKVRCQGTESCSAWVRIRRPAAAHAAKAKIKSKTTAIVVRHVKVVVAAGKTKRLVLRTKGVRRATLLRPRKIVLEIYDASSNRRLTKSTLGLRAARTG
jgi:hypothetical protein